MAMEGVIPIASRWLERSVSLRQRQDAARYVEMFLYQTVAADGGQC
jgi:hypothetical protein